MNQIFVLFVAECSVMEFLWTPRIWKELTIAAQGLGIETEAREFRLHKTHVQEFYGVLGRHVRVQLPECMERFIKSSFTNEGSANFVGFIDSNVGEQAQVEIIVVLILWCITKLFDNHLIIFC